MGYYNSLTPNVILRNILENPGWYTSYTPYQPEVAQGRLEMLLNFQQLIIDLTGMDIANASLLDEATAAAEAVGLCQRLDKSESNKIFISDSCNPQTIDLIKTRTEPFGLELFIGNDKEYLSKIKDNLICGVLAYPGTLGDIKDPSEIISQIHKKNGKVILISDLLSLTKLKTPAELGADIAVGSAQRFGIPMGYGGPHAAFIATKEELKRMLPGRLVGLSVDSLDRPALRLALQTREQHIRREKATSNICTAQVLLAVIAGFYAVYHGADGLKKIAQRVHAFTNLLYQELIDSGFKVLNQNFFDTLTIFTDDQTSEILSRAKKLKTNLRQVDNQHIALSIDETHSHDNIALLIEIFTSKKKLSNDQDLLNLGMHIDDSLIRESSFLQHPTFQKYHSETEMMRYLKRLKTKDIALDESMIPLGSCTMKLNSSAAMIPISWPEFANLHPFVPIEQASGYMHIIDSLGSMLTELTGFHSVSLQPNAGSQGEYAGLLVIKKWHEENHSINRKICLIPSSAHGTNPASAKVAGLEVVIIACDNEGNIDINDLKQKAQEYKDDLACLMVTYPSTHGVFENSIIEICEIVHQYGGLVYMDGANLNALVGICKPGKIGPDVAHFNLHKTFSIPHGGGGPGVGPIGVVEKLSHLLPNHPLIEEAGPKTGIGPIAAAPWGSASILIISWIYMKLMGFDRLKFATKIAILNANYLAKKLEVDYKILFKGENSLVAHECIVDLRLFKELVNVTAEDIAKRLIDFGFHAPTMSWPVANTFMIEPTESESKSEIDKFCNAMNKIAQEINKISEGIWSKEDNPIINSPHTAEMVTNNDWNHCYSREEAVFPLVAVQNNKYWPPVGRINNAFGDKNLFCSCPPIESTVS